MSNENIFREVDEELRSERTRKLWRRFGPFVIGAAVAIVVLVAVNEGWTWWQRSQAAESSQALYNALDLADGGDIEAAQSQLNDLIASGSGNYPTLARFRQAGLLAQAGNSAEAVAAYDALANAESNPVLRELALVMAGTLLIDSGTLADVEARVGSIATDGNPMRNAAREALGLAQYRAEDFAAAQLSFETILNDPLTQNGQRNRAGFYLAQLLAEGAIAPEPELVEEIENTTEAPVTDEAPAVSDMPIVEEPAVEAPAADATPETTPEDAPVAQ